MMGRVVFYRYESVCTSLMFLRAYHALRLYALHVHHRWLEETAYAGRATKAVTLQVLIDTRIDVAAMALKHSLAQRPGVVVAQVVCLSVWCGGYLIRVAEAPGNAAHANNLSNNLWLACLALTTSHYGAVAPLTHYGRSHTIFFMHIYTYIHIQIYTYKYIFIQTGCLSILMLLTLLAEVTP